MNQDPVARASAKRSSLRRLAVAYALITALALAACGGSTATSPSPGPYWAQFVQDCETEGLGTKADCEWHDAGVKKMGDTPAQTDPVLDVLAARVTSVRPSRPASARGDPLRLASSSGMREGQESVCPLDTLEASHPQHGRGIFATNLTQSAIFLLVMSYKSVAAISSRSATVRDLGNSLLGLA